MTSWRMLVSDWLVAIAVLLPASASAAVTATLDSPPAAEPDQPIAMKVALSNEGDQSATATVDYSLQSDPGLYSAAPPDPVYGSDHALGVRSWTVADGKTIEENSLTDGKEWTSASTEWRTKHWEEVFQFVDLGRSRHVIRIDWLSGDANWVAKVDVSASADGKSYTPVPSLQNVEVYKKRGRQTMPLKEPFDARFLRLRYHDDAGKKADVIRMPGALSVYDGVGDESFELPNVGPAVLKGTQRVELAPGANEAVSIGNDGKTSLSSGAYFLVAKVASPGRTELLYRNLLVLPEPLSTVSQSSRFGLNVSDPSLVSINRRLGVGWVRFENFKWPMVSPRRGEFRFDGSVGPWLVNHDVIIGEYSAAGITVLPFLFQTASYASSAGANVKEDRRWAYPPTDNATFAEFCFQSVARYGSAKHSADELRTPDKISGKGQIPVYEIWNEPNLTDPGWGPWVGTPVQYWSMFRAAAEAVKRADPTAKVTNGGFAGITVETIGELATHKYADGKRPIDFVEVLNVHYYSGRRAPEVATIDTNVERTRGNGSDDDPAAPTFEVHLRRLIAWRDANKPGLPIWLSETGNDTAGPWGVSEQLQAARLPRVVMTALANGIDKAFIYREKGSGPSLHAASGLLRDDGSYKPSYLSYGTLIRQLDGMTRCDRVANADPNLRVYLWRKDAAEKSGVLTAWAVEESVQGVTLGLDLGQREVTDAFGATRHIELTKATPLSIFPMYISGVDVARVTLQAR